MRKKKFVRKITRVGKRSLCVVIPKDIIEELEFVEKQKLILYRRGKRIIIENWEGNLAGEFSADSERKFPGGFDGV